MTELTFRVPSQACRGPRGQSADHLRLILKEIGGWAVLPDGRYSPVFP